MNPAPTNPNPVAPPPKPIYLSGTVIVDDSSPLPANVNIQSVCGSTRQRTVAHTGSTGDFGFLWGDTGAMFEDASESGRAPGSFSGLGSGLAGGGGVGGSGVRTADPLADCDLQAESPGYTSSRVSLFQHAALDNFDVGAIVLHRITGDEGRVVSLLSLKAPKDAKKSFDKGTEQMRAKKLADAAASFQKSVTSYPQYADAWVSLGRVQLQLGAKDAAREDFQKAMDLDDKLVGPWQELGFMASDQSRWEDAARYLDKAVRLDPTSSPMAWYFSAVADYNLGRFEQAEHSVRTELKLDKSPHAEYLLGLVLIARKDLKGGAEAIRTYLASSPKPEEAAMARKRLSQVENALGQ
jgi:tetratricopeptide (TPR) repeat protein